MHHNNFVTFEQSQNEYTKKLLKQGKKISELEDVIFNREYILRLKLQISAQDPLFVDNKEQRLIHLGEHIQQVVLAELARCDISKILYQPIVIDYTITPRQCVLLIEYFEEKKSALGYLIAGLLLEGKIETEVPEHYVFNNDYTKDYDEYYTKRLHDAITLYLQAANQDFKHVIQSLLWHLKVTGPDSVQQRLQKYFFVPPETVFSSYKFFNPQSSQINIHDSQSIAVNFNLKEAKKLHDEVNILQKLLYVAGFIAFYLESSESGDLKRPLMCFMLGAGMDLIKTLSRVFSHYAPVDSDNTQLNEEVNVVLRR